MAKALYKQKKANISIMDTGKTTIFYQILSRRIDFIFSHHKIRHELLVHLPSFLFAEKFINLYEKQYTKEQGNKGCSILFQAC